LDEDGQIWNCTRVLRIFLEGKINQPIESYQFDVSPLPLSEKGEWIDLFQGRETVVAQKSDGSYWSWGRDNYGYLGREFEWDDFHETPLPLGDLPPEAKFRLGKYITLVENKQGDILDIWGLKIFLHDSRTIRSDEERKVLSEHDWKY
jgi:alpha-tubulin suppressor-like RCC1 family protein